MSRTLSSSKGNVGFLWKRCLGKGTPQGCRGEFHSLRESCGGKLRVPLDFGITLWDHSCLLREVRSPLSLRGAPRDSSCIAAGMNRASSPVEAGTSGFLSISDFDIRVSADWNMRVRPHIVLRNGTPLASGVLPRVIGHLSSFI